MYGELFSVTDWWHDPGPEPDGWRRGEWLAVLAPFVGAAVLTVVVWWLEGKY